MSSEKSQSQSTDVAVIGAGAAGLMAGIQCARAGLNVRLLDGRDKVGAKILMSGGTRCNVTNEKVTEQDFSGEERIRIRNLLRAFSSDEAVAFFREIGVALVVEPGGKYFPVTHSARTVLEALLRALKQAGGQLVEGHKIRKVSYSDKGFEISSASSIFYAKTCVMATGGLSYPTTGSDGSGYELARSFGHTLVPTIPALTPFRTEDERFRQLAGVTLPVRLELWASGKRHAFFQDSFLFTHFGFSGPAALDLSRHWQRFHRQTTDAVVRVCFLPEMSEPQLLEVFQAVRQKSPQKQVRSFLAELLPERLAVLLTALAQIPADRKMTELRIPERKALLQHLLALVLPVSGVWGYQKAEVTAGGIPLTEVNPATLESLKQPGLYFAGEILDADGRIGGFNFQWAWATGTVAARGIRRQLQEA